MILGWWLVAWGQDYAFPSSPDDYGHYYPTAYKDHAGVDWNCGTIRYSGHQGSDFGAGSFAGMDDGRDVTAAAAGVVTTAHDGEFDRCTTGDCSGGYGFGNYVKIEHADGRRTLYGHLKQWSVAVAVGDAVSCGQKLGEMGSSGYSTGPHVHFEVRNSSEVAEDPFDGPCSSPPTQWLDQGAYGDLPGGVCDARPCTPEGQLTCGDVVVARNDGPGSLQQTWAYGCTPFVYSGPERSFEIVTDTHEPVTVRLEGMTADLDLLVLASEACDGSDCLAASSNPDASDELLTYDAVAGDTTVVVVDGWEGAVSDFVLTIECEGGTSSTGDTGGLRPTGLAPPTAHTGFTDTDVSFDDSGPPLPDTTTRRDDVEEVAPQDDAPRSGGCGCTSGAGPGSAWYAGWRRRRPIHRGDHPP